MVDVAMTPIRHLRRHPTALVWIVVFGLATSQWTAGARVDVVDASHAADSRAAQASALLAEDPDD